MKFFFKLITTFWLDLVRIHQVSEAKWYEYRLSVDTIYYEQGNRIILIQPGGVCYDLRHMFASGSLPEDPDLQAESYPLRYRMISLAGNNENCEKIPEKRQKIEESTTKSPKIILDNTDEIVNNRDLKLDILTGAVFPGCLGSNCQVWESMFEGGLQGVLWRHSIIKNFTSTDCIGC